MSGCEEERKEVMREGGGEIVHVAGREDQNDAEKGMKRQRTSEGSGGGRRGEGRGGEGLDFR